MIKKKIDCLFYLQGKCNKGEECQYYHNPTKSNKQPYIPRHKVYQHQDNGFQTDNKDFDKFEQQDEQNDQRQKFRKPIKDHQDGSIKKQKWLNGQPEQRYQNKQFKNDRPLYHPKENSYKNISFEKKKYNQDDQHDQDYIDNQDEYEGLSKYKRKSNKVSQNDDKDGLSSYKRKQNGISNFRRNQNESLSQKRKLDQDDSTYQDQEPKIQKYKNNYKRKLDQDDSTYQEIQISYVKNLFLDNVQKNVEKFINIQQKETQFLKEQKKQIKQIFVNIYLQIYFKTFKKYQNFQKILKISNNIKIVFQYHSNKKILYSTLKNVFELDIETGNQQQKRLSLTNQDFITKILYYKDVLILAIFNQGQSYIQFKQNQQIYNIQPAHNNIIQSLIIYNDILISGGLDAQIKFWNLNTLQLQLSVNNNLEICQILQYCDFLIVGNINGSINIYQIQQNNVVFIKQQMLYESQQIKGINTFNNKIIINGINDNIVYVLENENWEFEKCISYISICQNKYDQNIIVTGFYDGTILLFKDIYQKPFAEIQAHHGHKIVNIQMINNIQNKYMIIADEKGQISFWEFETESNIYN